jgi:hypothetical protein
MAGALAVPVWVALSAIADWRWLLKRGDTTGYPAMRLFRQFTLGECDAVVTRMAEDGRALAARRARGRAVRIEVSPGVLPDRITILRRCASGRRSGRRPLWAKSS